MGENSQYNDDEAKQEKKRGPSDLPLWSIVKSLTTGQFYSILLVLIGLFVAGYAIGQWASSAGHERELSDIADTHRLAIVEKDDVITSRDRRISDLETEVQTAKRNAEDALQVASAADRSARAFRAKAEFLNRYLSYLEDSSPSGTMRKLFADHVCALWRETQRDILSVDSNQITFQQVSRGSNLSPAALEALAAAGIDQRVIDEYLQLNRRRSQIEPRASRVQPNLSGRVDRSSDSEFRRLQQLEQRIGGHSRKECRRRLSPFSMGPDTKYLSRLLTMCIVGPIASLEQVTCP